MPKYYNYLINYNKILIQKNRVLKSRNIDDNLLDVYDESLSTYGSYIYIIRRDFIKKISNIANAMHTKLTNGIEDLQIRGKVNTTTMAKLRALGVLDGMPETSQLSLF